MSIIMRYANEDLDKDDLFWKARLTKNFELETLFEVSEKFGSQKRSVQISLDNRDLELTQVHESYSLLNKPVVLYYDDPSGTTKTFYGVVTELSKMGLDVEITISEELSLYMQQPLPDLQVAIDYYSDKGINENWNAVPIIIGNVKRLKTQWVDLVFSRYVIGSGPLASIDKVYFDDVIMYDKDRTSAENIFQTSDSSKRIGVIIWRGTGWESDPETQVHPLTGETITSVYPGVAYLEFYNVDATAYGSPTHEATPPVNADGSACEVYVDVQGISDPDTEPSSPTAERNPAKILYQLATNPRTSNDHDGFETADKGPRGFGLAISTDKIDFADAIAFCTANNIVIDGVIAQKLEASEWFDELAKYCMSTFKEIDGVLTLILDTAATTIKAHFSDDGINAYNCVIGDYKEPSYDKQINRIRLYYGYNVETGKFDKRPYGSEESPIPENSQYLRNESHYLKLLKWNTENFEYKFVQDDTTAHKIAQYNFKRNILQLKTVDITCGFDVVDLDVLDVISVTSTKHIWDKKQFRIKKIVRSDKGIKLTCLEYDSNVYTDECSGTVTIQDPNYPETPRPDKCILDSLQAVPTLTSDGTTDINLTLEFTPPSNNFVHVEIYYKPYSAGDPSPNEGYTYWASTSTSPYTKKWVNSLGKYRFRLVSVSPTGSKSFIKIESTDLHYYGQPGAETYLEISGDDTSPGKPIISNGSINAIPYGIVFTISISGGTPSDFDHFEIYRKIHRGDDPQYELINGNVKTFLYTDVNNSSLPYDTDIQYRAIAVDKTGNKSDYSDEHTAVQIKYVVGDDITNEPIIAKDFRTSANVGIECEGVYGAGVKFDAYGILGYDTTGKTFELANDGRLWLKGEIEASSGNIGGWCIGCDCLYATTTGTIATSAGAGAGTNSVVIDKDGIRGYHCILGNIFNLPTNGSAPTFSSGIINETIFKISTNAVLRTSEHVLEGEAGVLINNTGIYASDCTTIGGAVNAKVKILADGTLYLGGASPKLSWDGSDLTISGTVCADAGNIARWCIEDVGGDTSRIYSYNTCCDSDLSTSMNIYSQYCDGTHSGYPLIRMQIGTTINTSHHLSIGQMAWGNNNQNAFGFSIGLIKDCEAPLFAVGKALFGSVSIPDGDCAVPKGETFFWVGNSNNYIRWRSDTDELKLSGTIEAISGTIGGWTINSDNLASGDEYSNVIISTNIDGENHPGLAIAYCPTGDYWNNISIGRMTWGGEWKDGWGISMSSVQTGATPYFLAGRSDLGSIYLPDDTTCSDGLPQNTSFFWVGNSDNYIRWRSDTDELKLSGTIESTSGHIGCWIIDLGGLCNSQDREWEEPITHICYCWKSLTLLNPDLNTFYKKLTKISDGCSHTYCTGLYPGYLTFSHDTCDGDTGNIYIGIPIGTSCAAIGITVPATSCFGICTNGNICANCLYQTSSRETKRNFKDIGPILSYFDDIEMVAYQRKDSDQWGFGLMAEDIQEKFPWMFDGKSVHGIDMFALKGVKELHSLFKKLDERISLLERN